MTVGIIFIVFFVVFLVLIGVSNILKTRSTANYLIAGRNTGTLGTWGSLTATIVGGSSTMGMAGLSYSRGITGAWWLLVGIFGLILLPLFVKKIKAHRVYTLPQLIGHWYDERVRKISSILISLAWLGIVAAQISASGRLLNVFFGTFSVSTWIILSGLLFTTYTVSGGQISVIKTDFIQTILIIGGIFAASLFGLSNTGGLENLKSSMDTSFFSFPLSSHFHFKDLLFMILVVGTTYLIGPDIISRVFCSRNEKTAKQGIILTILTIIPIALIISLIGIEARFLFPNNTSEGAFPIMIKQVLPPFLGALTVTALISAFLSSADTTLLTLSAIISVDIVGVNDEKSLKYRIFTALAGVLSIVVAIFSGGIVPSLLLGYTIFTGGLAVPIIFGLSGKPLSVKAAIVSIIVGGATALTGKLINSTPIVISAYIVSLLVALVDKLFRKNS